MNVVKEIERINQRELDLGGSSSWHDEYTSAYIFVGGLPFELTEGDVIAVFSQYGEIADINMPRDKETGKPRGFAFLMYVNQKSTVLAVDNLNGAKVLGRTLRVDHTKGYEQPKVKDENGDIIETDEVFMNAMPEMTGGPSRQAIGDEAEDDIDDEDPMAAYIREQKRLRIQNGGDDEEGAGLSKVERKALKEEKRKRKEEKKAKKDKASSRDINDRYSNEDRYHRRPDRSLSPPSTSRRRRDDSPAQSSRRPRSPGHSGRREYDNRNREEPRESHYDRYRDSRPKERERDRYYEGDREYDRRRDVGDRPS